MLELESLMVQLHETGIILSQQKKVELECLLKNSVFGSTMILNLINDLLDLAKIESSTFKLNWTYFNLFDLIARSTETLDCQLASKRIMVSHEYKESDRDYLLFINGDSHRYFQILLNFMSNAVKFTPMDGSIKI
jgi:signal transduction histidine kinase